LWGGLKAIKLIPLNTDWGIIRGYQFINLQNGIDKVILFNDSAAGD